MTVPPTVAEPALAADAGAADQQHRANRAVLLLVSTLVGITVVGLVAGLTLIGRHGGGAIQGWDNQVEAWDIHHRTNLVWISKLVAQVGDATVLV
ncbi:MAG: hypothetical protein ACRDWB_14300, partial [Acidimicrobiales bacterium]